jgi:UDP-N-acetylglucosamine 2-epimerase (non-hydrolysing)/GDP/UDP-N,N'-diacetylbacillosamine 2-epimerase (hydrolysing)
VTVTKNITAISGARSDYGILRPVLQAIDAAPELALRLIACGSHLSPELGYTAREIRDEGLTFDTIESLLASDTPAGVAKSMGLGMLGFADIYARTRPDLLLVLGDRFEIMAAAAAAAPFCIPVAHIHGGEVTEGAIDDAFRHALTKLSHLHFASTRAYADRLIQMGEEPWRVTVSGAPSLDNLRSLELLDRRELEDRIELPLDPPPLLVTLHPESLEYRETERHAAALLGALELLAHPVLFTYPNADAGGRMIIAAIKDYVARHDRARVVQNLGQPGYFALMRDAAAMVGNSSSGIIEAASFGTPVVNIGRRQRGRLQNKNVINCSFDSQVIAAAIGRAVSPRFRESLVGLKNIYGDGHAAPRIVEALKRIPLDDALVHKRFHDQEPRHG